MKFDLDLVVMLLSSDWFFPEWRVLGLFETDGTKRRLQKGCRDIVRQFITNADQYWKISFNAERLRDTRSRVDALVRECGLAEASIERIDRLTSSDEPPVDEGTRWLLVTMTEQLLGKSNGEGPSLDSSFKEALAEEWGHLTELDFGRSCLASMTEWDCYLRELTPDQPAMLAAYVASLVSDGKFEVLWGFIHSKLTTKERQTLLGWYRSKAKTLTGEPLRLGYEA